MVLAGEDRNDRRSLRVLLESLCPQMCGRIVEITDDVRLRKASGATLTRRVDTLARKVRAKATQEKAEVACVFVHEDFDEMDGEEYPKVRTRVERELRSRLDTAHYALAVAETEAWMLLFPSALEQFVTSWELPDSHRGKDTGRMADPKKVLMTVVGRKAKRRYREADAPEIFRRIVQGDHIGTPEGSNRSWDRFRADAEQCGEYHVSRARK